MKKLLQKQKEAKQAYKDKKKEFDKILSDYKEQERLATIALQEAFIKNKLYLPISKLRDYKGKCLTMCLPTITKGLAYLENVYVNKDNELEYSNGEPVKNSYRFLGFYNVYINDKLDETTTMEYLINENRVL